MNLADTQQMALDLLAEHELLRAWRFKFNRATRRFGCCHHHSKVIALSAPITLLNDEVQVRDTLLHEIAHALMGHAAGHGPAWVKKAKSLGCMGTRCYDDSVVTPPARWIGTCPSCGVTTTRMVVSRLTSRLVCTKCLRESGLRLRFIWKETG